MKHTSYIGIGSNLGDRAENIRRAIDLLNDHTKIEVTKTSSLYETKAVLPKGAPDQPPFLNGALEIQTDLEPIDLLKVLMKTEKTMGRPSPRPKNEPRTIDLDILLYDDLILDLPDLKIPHPALEKRLFVLEPLCDIAPAVQHPVLARTIGELMRN